MTAVGARRTTAPDTTLDAGAAVRGLPWNDTALLANWVLGQGAQLVPACFPNVTLESGKTSELYFRVRPRYQAFERVWCVTLRTDDTASTAAVTADIVAPPGGTTENRGVSRSRDTARPIMVRERMASQSAAESEIGIEITPVGGDVILESISCWEVARAKLSTSASDDGADTTKYSAGQPVRSGDFANLADALTDETKIGRRASLYQWAVPSTVNSALTAGFAWTTATTSYTDIFALPVPILARKIGISATTGVVKFKALAWVDANSATIYGSSSVNGDSNSATITATTPTWTSAITIDVDCDDVDSDDGRQTSGTPAWDELDIRVKCASTATTGVYISAISVWED